MPSGLRPGQSYTPRRGAYPNVMAKRGIVVHAATQNGYPQCSKFLHSVVFTNAPVSCVDCLTVSGATQVPPLCEDHARAAS
jgi:hypothetical protein